MNDFFKDLKKRVKSSPENDKILAAYNRGLITLNEALKEIIRNDTSIKAATKENTLLDVVAAWDKAIEKKGYIN